MEAKGQTFYLPSLFPTISLLIKKFRLNIIIFLNRVIVAGQPRQLCFLPIEMCCVVFVDEGLKKEMDMIVCEGLEPENFHK